MLNFRLNLFNMMRIFLFITFIASAVAGRAQVDFKKLDAYYEKALRDWGVPGMSIAIVKDGKVVFAKGYGVKETGKQERPDGNTLYAIASNTKAFTSAAIAQLVDENKLAWNDKVKKYLPYFELYDPWVSAEANIRDILSHRVGLGTFSGDILWYRSDFTAEDILRRAKYLPKAFDFRAGYGYQNLMYLAAGEVLEKVSGKRYGELVKERFFTPLGMNRTITSLKELESKGNVASPHAWIDGTHRPIPWDNWEPIVAMGGIISSVNDMSDWMIFNLQNGIWKNDTLLSPASRNLMWTPHSNFVVDQTQNDKSIHFRGYGLGWNLADYRGKLRVSHTGGYTGMLSTVVLVPDENLGVVVLTNGMKGIFTPLANYTLDAFLKAPEKDWSGEALVRLAKNKDTRIDDRKKSRVMNTRPGLPANKIEGIYYTPTYGKISVKSEGGKLRIEFEHSKDLNATLEHWHFDVYELKWDKADILTWFSFGTVKFESDNNGKVTGISFDVPNDDLWFEELNAKKIN